MKISELLCETDKYNSRFAQFKSFAVSAVGALSNMNANISDSIKAKSEISLGLSYNKWMTDNIVGIKAVSNDLAKQLRNDKNLVEPLQSLSSTALSAYNADGRKRHGSNIDSKAKMFIPTVIDMISSLSNMKQGKGVPDNLREDLFAVGQKLKTTYFQHQKLMMQLKDVLAAEKEKGNAVDQQKQRDTKSVSGSQSSAANDMVSQILGSVDISKQDRADIRRVVDRSDNKLAVLMQELQKRGISPQ